MALLKKVTLEQVDNLSRPRWRLVDSLDDTDLFETMDKAFPVKKKKATGAPKGSGLFLGHDRGSRYDRYARVRNSALAFCLLGLVQQGDTQRAIDYALESDGESPGRALQPDVTGLPTRAPDFIDPCGGHGLYYP